MNNSALAPLLAEVYFPLPLDHGFDYLIPPHMAEQVKPGMRVLAPFGKKGLQLGLVMALHPPPDTPPRFAWKPLEKTLDPEPALGEKDLRLAQWMARRYFCSLGEALFTALPIGKHLPPKKPRPPKGPEFSPAPSEPLTLTAAQETACASILEAVKTGGFKPFLVFGVAAAGKTEVYFRAAGEALGLGKSVIYLVPEIGLTPQVQQLLENRFPGLVDVWHSDRTPAERWRVWQRILSGECRVLLGARSAIFAPMKDLGLIVIDEEHDTSYKEDSKPFYHARDVALEKAALHKIPVVLGSATPSLETYCRARDGEFKLLEMPRKARDFPATVFRIINMKKNPGWYMSDPLVQAVQDRLAKQEQTMLFLNRRGYATYIVCRQCGWDARCPKCGVSLVFHKKDVSSSSEELRCHYCSFRMALPEKCGKCREATVKNQGRGTQRVIADLQLLFPKARLLRWDRDSTRKRHGHREAYEAVQAQTVDILVGTRMVAQGLDFPRMTLVGVLDADQTLRFPDFRAAERTYQLLAQVSGRAGRADRPGEVFLQTRHADHYALRAAADMDYRVFADEELVFRKEIGYPPFSRLVHVLVRARKPEQAEAASENLMQWLENLPPPEDVICLGPAPAFEKQRRGFTQWQVLIKGPDALVDRMVQSLRAYKPPPGALLSVNVDPEDA